jgi:peptidoglycan/xylan/chitin deacetylase (PgdA/CDA1 family)
VNTANARRVLRWSWAHILAACGCFWWAKRRLRRLGAVVPLTFHRVLACEDRGRTHSLPGVVLSEHAFSDLIEYVVRRCEAVDLRRFEPGVRGRRVKVAFTFDDGWIDTYTVAFPIAQKHRVPFIVFLCPGLIDQHSAFWPEQLVALMQTTQPSRRIEDTEMLIEDLKRWSPERRQQYLAELRERSGLVQSTTVDRTLSWAAIRDMRRRGISFGAHTQTHQILTEVPPDMARQEVRASKVEIESALLEDCDAFAYPNGDYSPETRQILADAGFRLAVTNLPGAWTLKSDRLAIPRSNICEDNVVGPSGTFSEAMFEYSTFWKALKATWADARFKSHTPRPIDPAMAWTARTNPCRKH